MPRQVAEQLGRRKEVAQLVEQELDNGLGACWLRQDDIARVVENVLLHFDRADYRLLAWCIMPNHVHALIEPDSGRSLSDIVRRWKSFSARRANEILRCTGPFWHPDYFDRFMRDESHLERTIHYVEQNPVKAGLAPKAAGWPWSSARRRER
ncbi:MAG TPA: transposase [Reyranellaceae bacterium]|nr:transposase [Reyranellaceae bacterium]